MNFATVFGGIEAKRWMHRGLRPWKRRRWTFRPGTAGLSFALGEELCVQRYFTKLNKFTTHLRQTEGVGGTPAGAPRFLLPEAGEAAGSLPPAPRGSSPGSRLSPTAGRRGRAPGRSATPPGTGRGGTCRTHCPGSRRRRGASGRGRRGRI